MQLMGFSGHKLLMIKYFLPNDILFYLILNLVDVLDHFVEIRVPVQDANMSND